VKRRDSKKRRSKPKAPVSDNSEVLIKKRDEEHLKFLKAQGISEYDIEMTDVTDKETVIKLKTSLRVRFPMLVTNILKILLHKEEEKLGCLLTGYYELAVDEEMVIRAVEMK